MQLERFRFTAIPARLMTTPDAPRTFRPRDCPNCREHLGIKGLFCPNCGMPRPSDSTIGTSIDRLFPEEIPTWPAKVFWVTVAMLLWGLLPFNPYSYYVLMRWVVCIVMGWQAVLAKGARMFGWMCGLFTVSVIYNPLVGLSFSRATWGAFNVATVVMLFVLPFAIGRNLTRKPR